MHLVLGVMRCTHRGTLQSLAKFCGTVSAVVDRANAVNVSTPAPIDTSDFSIASAFPAFACIEMPSLSRTAWKSPPQAKAAQFGQYWLHVKEAAAKGRAGSSKDPYLRKRAREEQWRQNHC